MSYFPFQRFRIEQDRCAHRVGTDGMLLGAWVRLGASRSILDIGTGTGLLALMLAQASEGQPLAVNIDAIEIDPASALQARENIAASPWPDRIEVHTVALADWKPAKAYDLIVCNPPFFSGPARAATAERQQARHVESLPPQELLGQALRLLQPEGRLALVLPLDSGRRLIRHAAEMGLFPSRRCLLRHSLAHAPKRLLLELWRGPENPAIDELAIREADGSYSAAYLALTDSFHSPKAPPGYVRNKS